MGKIPEKVFRIKPITLTRGHRSPNAIAPKISGPTNYPLKAARMRHRLVPLQLTNYLDLLLLLFGIRDIPDEC